MVTGNTRNSGKIDACEVEGCHRLGMEHLPALERLAFSWTLSEVDLDLDTIGHFREPRGRRKHSVLLVAVKQ